MMPNDDFSDTPSLPPGDMTSAELMKAVFPLVVQAAAKSAAAAVQAAEQARSMEQAMAEFRLALDRNSDAAKACANMRQKELDLQQKGFELQERREGFAQQEGGRKNDQWHKTLRTSMTTLRTGMVSPVVLQIIQLIVIVGTAFGLWTQFPVIPADNPERTLSAPVSSEETSATVSPGTP